MKLTEVVGRVRGAGFECSADLVRLYEKEGLLPHSSGGGGRGRAVEYPDSAYSILLLLLTLKKAPPSGLGLYHLEELRQFIGTQEQAGQMLPMLSYIFDLPNADLDAARQAAVGFLNSEVQHAEKDSEAIQTIVPGIAPIMPLILGEWGYNDPEIYSIPDDRSDDGSPTLKDELTQTMMEFAPKSLGIDIEEFNSAGMNENDYAMLADVSIPKNRKRAIEGASEEVLLLSAYWVRVICAAGMLRRFKSPYANGVIHTWILALSALTLNPAWIDMAKMLKQVVPFALKTVEEADDPKRGEQFLQYAERNIHLMIATLVQ